jgi:hypothetical protein
VLDVTEGWLDLIFSIVAHVVNLDNDIIGLFLLILYNGICG